MMSNKKAMKCQGRRQDSNQTLIFADYPEFKPNLTPEQIFKSGSFGGTYFRPIYSSITNKHYDKAWEEFPRSWFPTDLQYVNSPVCLAKSINKYGVASGTSLEYWEQQGWIRDIDPYGWVQWYCRFFNGRRSDDDERQIDRWNKIAGEKSGRWRKNLQNKIKKAAIPQKLDKNDPQVLDDYSISPVIRQLLLQWAFELQHID